MVGAIIFSGYQFWQLTRELLYGRYGGHEKRHSFFSAALALDSLSLFLGPQLVTAGSAYALQLQAQLSELFLMEMDNAA